MRRGSLRHKPWPVAAPLAALTVLSLPAAPAASRTEVIDAKGCTAVIADHEVPLARVEPLIPDEFTIATDDDEIATVFVYGERCEAVTINDVTRPVIWAAFRVELTDVFGCGGEPEGSEELEQCKSESQPRVPLHLDTYQFFIAYNDRDLVRLFEQVGATPEEAVYVEDLVFDLDWDPTRSVGRFSFDAPSPTPSPFKIKVDEVAAPRVGPVRLDQHEWGAVPRGLFYVGEPNAVVARIAPVHQGTLHAEAGSDMAKILCATEISNLDEDYRMVSWSSETAGIVSFDSQFAVHAVERPPVSWPNPGPGGTCG